MKDLFILCKPRAEDFNHMPYMLKISLRASSVQTTTAADMTHMLPDQTLTCQYLIANALKTKHSHCILYSNMLQTVKSYIFSSSDLLDPTHLYADNFLSILSYKCFFFPAHVRVRICLSCFAPSSEL